MRAWLQICSTHLKKKLGVVARALIPVLVKQRQEDLWGLPASLSIQPVGSRLRVRACLKNNMETDRETHSSVDLWLPHISYALEPM